MQVSQIVADASTKKAIDAQAPKTWNGTINSYNASTNIAKVVLDGDTQTIEAVVTGTFTPVATNRVLVLLSPPSAAFVLGLLTAPAPVPVNYVGLVGDDTISGNKTFLGTLSARGAVSESVLGVARADIGVLGGTSRLVLEDPTAATGAKVWEIDNSLGVLRFITPGSLKMTLDVDGLLNVSSLTANNGQVRSLGSSAGLIFADRAGPAVGTLWQWYASGSAAILHNGSANVFSMDNSGSVTVYNHLGVTGNLYMTGAVLTPNVQSKSAAGPYASFGSDISGNGSVDIANRNQVANTPLRVLGISGQTGDVFRIYHDGATLGVAVNASGAIIANRGFYAGGPVNGDTGFGHLHATGYSASSVKLMIDVPSDQSVDMAQFKKAGSLISRIASDGVIHAKRIYRKITAYAPGPAQTFPNASLTAVLLQTDLGGYLASADGAYGINVPTTGRYLVTGRLKVVLSGSGTCHMHLVKNRSTTFTELDDPHLQVYTGGEISPSITTVVNLVAGDNLSMYFYQDTGLTATLATPPTEATVFLSADYLGPS